MMAVARNVGDADASIKAGKWERSRLTGIEAKGKTLGIIGLGKGMWNSRHRDSIELTSISRSHSGPYRKWLWDAPNSL